MVVRIVERLEESLEKEVGYGRVKNLGEGVCGGNRCWKTEVQWKLHYHTNTHNVGNSSN